MLGPRRARSARRARLLASLTGPSAAVNACRAVRPTATLSPTCATHRSPASVSRTERPPSVKVTDSRLLLTAQRCAPFVTASVSQRPFEHETAGTAGGGASDCPEGRSDPALRRVDRRADPRSREGRSTTEGDDARLQRSSPARRAPPYRCSGGSLGTSHQ